MMPQTRFSRAQNRERGRGLVFGARSGAHCITAEYLPAANELIDARDFAILFSNSLQRYETSLSIFFGPWGSSICTKESCQSFIGQKK